MNSQPNDEIEEKLKQPENLLQSQDFFNHAQNQSQAPQTWECQECTQDNQMTSKNCEMCEKPRPDSVNQAKNNRPDSVYLDTVQENIFKDYQNDIQSKNPQGNQGVQTLNSDQNLDGSKQRSSVQNLDELNGTGQKKMKLNDGTSSPKLSPEKIKSLREKFKGEAKFVSESMIKFEQDMKQNMFPDEVYLINKLWFDTWKTQVKFDQLMPKQTIQNPLAAKSTLNPYFNPTPIGGGGGANTLGRKLQEEQEFKLHKEKEMEEAKLAQEKVEDELYSDQYLQSLRQLGQIKNLKFLKDPKTFINERVENETITKQNAHNFPLSDTVMLFSDFEAVPKEVIFFLGDKYGVDKIIPVYKNMVCEAWKKNISERYKFKYEEVQVLVMVPILEVDKFGESIKVLDLDGKEKQQTQNTFPLFSTLNKNNVPPIPSQNNIPKPPPFQGGSVPMPPAPQTNKVTPTSNWFCPKCQMENQDSDKHCNACLELRQVFPAQPLPTFTVPSPPVPQASTIPPVPPSSIPAPPLPQSIPVPPPIPGGSSIPPVPGSAQNIPDPQDKPVKPKEFPFSVQNLSIFVQRASTVGQFKDRVCKYLKVEPTKARIWRYENNVNTWNTKVDQKTKNLVNYLDKEQFVLDDGSFAKEIMFPGLNMDIASDKEISSLNQKNGGRLCTDKEVIFVETLLKDSKDFTFKFSTQQKDYTKCKLTSCSKIGLFERVTCVCGKIHYCSEACMNKDVAHKNSCEEMKRREFDPQYIVFEVAKDPRNGIYGLQNMGNTCYMNSALQCLSHTQPLIHFFTKLMLFKEQLNPTNNWGSKNNQVAIYFAKFLHTMWNEGLTAKTNSFMQGAFNPFALKMAIGNKNDMFKGNAQHDSSELITTLLDVIHEDLNRVPVKPKIEMPSDEDQDNLNDFELEQLQTEAHLKQNQSVILDLFFGQQKSSITCSNCKNVSKQLQPFMTLYVGIPQMYYDINYYFVPYQPNEKIFKHTLQRVPLVEQLKNGVQINSLYQLKQKVCQVVKQFYFSSSHIEPKSQSQIRYPLTSHSQHGQQFVDIVPQDLVVTSVNITLSQFKFIKLFSEHKGHTLQDLTNHEAQMFGSTHIFIYQLDPQSVNIDKVRQCQGVGTDQNLVFPDFLREGWMMAPVEIASFNREQYDTQKQNLQVQPDSKPEDLKPTLNHQPPRLAMIHSSWTTDQVHQDIMIRFSQFLHNKSADDYQQKYSQMPKKPKKKKKVQFSAFADDEYQINHDLSDDEIMHDQSQIQDDDLDFDQDQIYQGQNQQNLFKPRPHYTFHELFAYLQQWRQMNHGKNPGFTDLDSYTGEFVQPMSLNLVSGKKIWHCPLGLPFTIFGTLIDKQKSKDCNDYIFVDVNPELKFENEKEEQPSKRAGGKNKILKFQVIFNLNTLPDSISAQDIQQANQSFHIYQHKFVFDRFQRVLKCIDPNENLSNNQINSYGGQDQQIEVDPEQIDGGSLALDLDQCLTNMRKPEILKDSSAYACHKCKSPQDASKCNEIVKLPPILILCLQRFKNGVKNSDVVDFPIQGLDMSKHCKNSSQDPSDMIYDLYGVVNHFGSLNSGHYTANCFNESHNKWFNFNDSMVSEVYKGIGQPSLEELKPDIVKQSAYVLFYKRRGFKAESKEDFQQIQIQQTGASDHLIKIVQPQAQIVQQSQDAPQNQDVVAPAQDETMNHVSSNQSAADPQAKPFVITQESSAMLDIAQDADLDDLQQISLMEAGVQMNPQDNFSLQNEGSTFAPGSPSVTAAPHVFETNQNNGYDLNGYQIIGQVGDISSDDEKQRSKSSEEMNED